MLPLIVVECPAPTNPQYKDKCLWTASIIIMYIMKFFLV